MVQAFREVFGRLPYLATALLTSAGLFAFSMWLRNLALLYEALTSPAFSPTGKIFLFVNVLGGIVTAVTPLSAALILVMSLLFGINTALFFYGIRQRRLVGRGGLGTAGALVSGVLGVGCAACGSFLLGSLLASFGAAGAIALFPLRGEELSVLAVGLLSISMVWLTKSIRRGKVCSL